MVLDMVPMEPRILCGRLLLEQSELTPASCPNDAPWFPELYLILITLGSEPV